MRTHEAARFAAMMTKTADPKRKIATEPTDTEVRVRNACASGLRAAGKRMFRGSGRSAADSQYPAIKTLVRLRPKGERPSIAPLALTACGKDDGSQRGLGRHTLVEPLEARLVARPCA